jgi:hypothetical protein
MAGLSIGAGLSVGKGLSEPSTGLWSGQEGLSNTGSGSSGPGQGIQTDAGVQITTDAGVQINTSS